MKDGHYIDEDGDEVWVQDGEYHREDGPAVIWTDGSQFWYQNGKIHRDNGPAIISSNGDESWYKNGDLHREDGPAVITKFEKSYYLNDIPYPNIENDVLWRIEVQKMKRKKEKELI